MIKVQSKQDMNQIQHKLKTHTKEQNVNHRNNLEGLNEMHFLGCESINITMEALAIGKIPPEQIADLIRASGF